MPKKKTKEEKLLEKLKKQMLEVIKEKGKKQINWGYARVSSLEQSLERQKMELEKFGIDFLIEEKASGKNFEERIFYKLLLENMRKGDRIICYSIDRFSRNTVLTLQELKNLEKAGILVTFIRENVNTENTLASQIIINVMATIAEIERENLLERQAQGYKALQKDENGRMLSKKGTIIGGKEKKFTNKQLELIKEYRNGKSIYNLSQLARLINVSRPTLYKKIKELDTAN